MTHFDIYVAVKRRRDNKRLFEFLLFFHIFYELQAMLKLIVETATRSLFLVYWLNLRNVLSSSKNESNAYIF